LLAPPESVVALVFSLRLTHYPRSLWIGEYFRGSLDHGSQPLDVHFESVKRADKGGQPVNKTQQTITIEEMLKVGQSISAMHARLV